MADMACNDPAASEYAQVLLLLKSAKMVVARLQDDTAVTIIEALQRLCLARSGAVGESTSTSRQADRPRAPVAALTVHMLGSFQSFLNGLRLNSWRKKSERIFKYLVFNRATPIHRDQLLDLFWPDTDPQSARNCLNVTMHALRHSLEQASGTSLNGRLIQFTDEHYHLHSHLSVWSDAEVFTEHMARAQATIKQGDHAGAIAHYELAAVLYRGDLLEDDRYEEWVLSPRERLRSSYINLLTVLSQLYFETGNYHASMDCSRKILDRDNCCEDAHCQIMRCYYALGQRSLAIRQYFLSCDTLCRELGMPPMDTTTHLYEQIRQGDLRDG